MKSGRPMDSMMTHESRACDWNFRSCVLKRIIYCSNARVRMIRSAALWQPLSRERQCGKIAHSLLALFVLIRILQEHLLYTGSLITKKNTPLMLPNNDTYRPTLYSCVSHFPAILFATPSPFFPPPKLVKL